MSYRFKNDNRRKQQNIVINPNQAINFYKTHSLTDTAKAFGVQRHAIAKMLTKFNVPQRSRQEALKLFAWQNRSHIPQESANWKGGRYTNEKGYVRIYQPDHPKANHKGYVLEHIVNWGKANGRHLPKGLIVHHVNGIRNDNRPENLSTMPKGEHTRFHNKRRKKNCV